MEDFKAERDHLDFDKEELSRIIYDGEENLQWHRKVVKTFAEDPVLKIDHTFYDLPREKQLEFNLKRAVRMEELNRTSDFPKPENMTIGKLADYSGSVSAAGLHYGMFETAIKYLGSEEQCKEYLPKIAKLECWGCYAQTEIGHGSDVSSLETTATFDKDTDSFIVNSPTITSGKCWPGELGKAANYAAFHAQMIIGEKNYGVHTFLTQIRDLDSHRPLKGLEIGDIGPKGGYQQKDNGYMYFKHFRIPRTALLGKYTKVDKNGNFTIKGNPKFAYASMMFIRIYLIGVASTYPAKALTIGLKYSITRKQFKTLENGTKERKLLDYQAHQAALTPIVAFTFATLFVKFKVFDLFKRMIDKITRKNDFKLMKDMHALCSCLKSHYTDKTLEYLKIIRECCGGHGFSNYSGIPNLIDVAAPNVTLEGDNVVMYQQTARHLIKSCAKIVQGKQLKDDLSYMNDLMSFDGKKLKKFNPDNLDHLESILKAHALYHVARVGKYMQMNQSISFEDKWNKHFQADIVKLGQAHAVYVTAVTFLEAVKNREMSEPLRKHLTCLCKIHLAHSIINYADGAILSGYAKGKHLAQAEEFMYEKMEEIRPQLLNLIEAFDYPEDALNSIIGKSEGDVYQKLYEAAAWNPMNAADSLDSIETYVKPMVKRLKASL